MPAPDGSDPAPFPLGGVRDGFRSGFCVLAGRPNVGKSTLVNSLVGSKVSIVSARPQTTRHRVQGVVTRENHQLILLDVPGFQKPRDTLTERMQEVVDTTLGEVDAVLWVLPANEPLGRGDRYVGERLTSTPAEIVVAVNKADLVGREQLGRVLGGVRDLSASDRVHAVSALQGWGLEELEADLAATLPEGPMYFPPGFVTDQPEEALVAEIIREKVLEVAREEVPHAVAVQVHDMEARSGRDLVDIRAIIYVERRSQKPIIVGSKGRRIRDVGAAARSEIEALLGSQVFLDLTVKVRGGWRDDEGMLERLGL